MRKGRDGEKREKRGKKKKIRMKIVATTSLPAVDPPNADRWNAPRSRQNYSIPKNHSQTIGIGVAGLLIVLVDNHAKHSVELGQCSANTRSDFQS